MGELQGYLWVCLVTEEHPSSLKSQGLEFKILIHIMIAHIKSLVEIPILVVCMKIFNMDLADPLHPNISIHILHTVLYTFP